MSGVGEICKHLEKSLNLTPINGDEKFQLRKKTSPTALSEKPLGSNHINNQDIPKGLSLMKKNELSKCNEISETRRISFSSSINEAVKTLAEVDNVSNSNEVNTSKTLKKSPVKPAIANKPLVPLKVPSNSNLSSFTSKSIISKDQKNSLMKDNTLYKKDMQATISSNLVQKDEVKLCNNVNSGPINEVVPTENNFLENNDNYDDINAVTNKVEKSNNSYHETNDTYDDINPISFKAEETNNVCAEEDIYDDIKAEETNNGCTKDETYDDIKAEDINNGYAENDIYDDIKTEETNHVCAKDETYDDVKAEETNNGCTKNDTYDDIKAEDINNGYAENDIYDDIKVEETNNGCAKNDIKCKKAETTCDDIQTAPVKPPKSFSCVDPLLFNTPTGLEVWLKKLLDENGQQLNNLNVTEAQKFSSQKDLKLSQLVDKISGKNNDEKTIDNTDKIKDGKDKKILEVTDKKKLKKEKKDLEERNKAEKKKKMKEYKQFNLDVNKELEIIGQYVCKSNYSSKKKNTLDLSFQYGDEVSVIESSSCPSGKVLVQRTSDGKLGYILKNELGIVEVENERPRLPSLIPTEDELDKPEVYEIIDTAPPVSMRPRPQLQIDGLKNAPIQCFDSQKVIDTSVQDELYQMCDDIRPSA